MPIPTFRRGGADNITEPLPGMPQPTVAPRPASALPVPEYKGKRNGYAGKCSRCGANVPPNHGSLENRGGQWVTTHLGTCPDPDALADAPIVGASIQTKIKGRVLYDGIYTVTDLPSGDRTFRVRTQASDDDFMPGVQILSWLNGPDNTRDFQSFAHVTSTGSLRVWKKWQDRLTIVKDAEMFLKDPHGDSVLPAIQCYRCHKTLTVAASIHNGLGPDCATKGY